MFAFIKFNNALEFSICVGGISSGSFVEKNFRRFGLGGFASDIKGAGEGCHIEGRDDG